MPDVSPMTSGGKSTFVQLNALAGETVILKVSTPLGLVEVNYCAPNALANMCVAMTGDATAGPLNTVANMPSGNSPQQYMSDTTCPGWQGSKLYVYNASEPSWQ